MSADCIFCRIVAGEIPSTKVFEDEHVFAFEDIQPQAPVHVLVVPKRHLKDTNELRTNDAALLGSLFAAALQVARTKGILDSGYRLITNTGKDAGQVVPHLHFHVMGGKVLGPLG